MNVPRQNPEGNRADSSCWSVPEEPNSIAEEGARDDLKMYVDLYKFLSGLFIKGMAMYFTIIAAIAGFAFRQAVSPREQSVLLSIAAAISIVSAICSTFSLKQFDQVQIVVDRLCRTLHIDVVPLLATRGIIVTFLVFCLFASAIGAVLAIFA